uniref:Uncharacterized protein LOC101242677 n=1 Tax=Phallusia mammillata TaxID=59560 RepID=A0A6F9DJF0_9ASCI|nr:uncharacterized protein LOC101242677 [Phallusia mammillata]
MKVICAGMSKTGTKTMQLALQMLGYEVYDFLENYTILGDDWERIFKNGSTTEDFRRMYENVDAVTDIPAAYFWDEIHKAFPDSKIILMLRPDEDTWWSSIEAQNKTLTSFSYRLTTFLSPTLRGLGTFGRRLAVAVYGWESPPLSLFGSSPLNELLIRMTYRRHNAHVLQNAPKDKLLVYCVKDGWEPLCEFLGVEVPKDPFPHKNVRGNIVEELFKTNPVFIRMQREAAFSACAILALTLYGGYKLARGSTPVSWAKYWSSIAYSCLTKIKAIK